jgi:acetyl esterase/lipase
VVYSKDAPKLIAASLGIETTFPRDLKMDIFMPPPTDTLRQRPLVILAHGGGFVDVAFMGGTILVGTKDNEDIQALADTLAHWGFVTASIEYRTGFDVLSTTSLKRAVWRGSQDMSAAMRFFRKNAQWFGIDPTKVFIGGSSAGAFASIHATFMDHSERIPESLSQGIGMGDLGSMHSRPVVELSGFNPFTGNNVQGNDVDSLPLALVGFWGAIADPAFLQGNNRAPMIMFHGTDDLIVDDRCSPPFSGLIIAAPSTCGSVIMDSVLSVLGQPHETYIEAGQGHEYWGALNGEWTLTGPNAFWKPMIERTANFFWMQMRPSPPNIQFPNPIFAQTNYTFSISNPSPGMQYCWEVDGGSIVSPTPHNGSSIQVQFWNSTSLGAVKARAINSSQVASLQRLVYVNVQQPTSLNSSPSALQAQLFPNPNQGRFIIQGNFQDGQEINIQALNPLGQTCHQGQHFAEQGQVHLELSQLPQGIYYLQVQQAEHKINLSLHRQ